MLILTRRINETLNIGDDIQVTVLGIKGNQVRIGINAPRDVPVHREEIYQKIIEEDDAPQAADSTEQLSSEGEESDEAQKVGFEKESYDSDHDYRGVDYFSDEDSSGNV